MRRHQFLYGFVAGVLLAFALMLLLAPGIGEAS